MNATAFSPSLATPRFRPLDAALGALPAALEPAACCGTGMRHSPPMHAGDPVFHAGDTFGDFYIVRSGSYKCYTLDVHGQESVSGFRFAGEPLGLNAIFTGRHPDHAVALETSTVWIVAYDELRGLAAVDAELRARFFWLMGQQMAEAARLAGEFTAEERVARFLLELSQRFARCGCSASSFNLSMTRRDIGNHLRLATETVTRVLARFEEHGWIAVDRRQVNLRDSASLQRLCAGMEGGRVAGLPAA